MSDSGDGEQGYLQSLLDVIDTIVVVVGLDGTIREWNRRAESLSGESREQVLGRSYTDFLPEHERERVASDIRRLAEGGEPTQNVETSTATAHGIRRVLWRANLIRDERGEPAVLAAGVDLTAQKDAEFLLRETQRRALEAEKLASIAALTAGIAHDIGTPMTAILGYAELIAKSAGDEKNRKRATTIVNQVGRVSDLLDTLMTLARAEAHTPVPLKLGEVLDDALRLYRDRLRDRGIEVERDYAAAPEVSGDSARLQRVLLNLMMNAIEAMPEGGTLRVTLGQTEAGEAEIRVSDTGTGVDPELRERIFEPYFTTKQRTSGTGLGLLVAKSIVEEHGGKIELASDPGRGTEFRISFPKHSTA